MTSVDGTCPEDCLALKLPGCVDTTAANYEAWANVSKNHELCNKNEELCIENDQVCIQMMNSSGR